jgi:ATP phosphoribosyltransferase
MSGPLRIALAKGRLLNEAVVRLARVGIVPSEDLKSTRLLVVPASAGAELLLLKDPDVPVYVERGAADVGIVGIDHIRESGCDVLEPLELDFGRCRLSLCAPGPAHRELAAQPGRALRIATKYPHLATLLLGQKGLGIEILKLSGSVELAPVVGLSDAIVDLVETGRTLERNGLSEREVLLQVSGRLIVNRAAWRLKMPAVQALIDGLERAGRGPLQPAPA